MQNNKETVYDNLARRPENLSSKRLEILTAARSWLGTRWVHQGRTAAGIDCAGLIVLVGKEVDLFHYDTTDYQRRTTGYNFMKHFNNNMVRKKNSERMPGDIILTRDSYFPCHCGIIGADHLGNETIIHAYAPRKKVVEDRLDQGDFLQRLVAIFEFEGM